MTFQEQLTADVDQVFLNLGEFGVTLSIGWSGHEPEPVSCILDESEGQNTSDGVTQWDATLYVKAGDIATPIVEQRLDIVDGNGTRRFQVAKVSEDMGALTIALRRFDS